MKPKIWCSLTDIETIKAEYMDGTIKRSVEVNMFSREVTSTHQADEGTDAFRWLVNAARMHCA